MKWNPYNCCGKEVECMWKVMSSGCKFTAQAGVGIRKKLFTRHKFTSFLKSVPPWGVIMVHVWLVNLLDNPKMAFPHLKGKINWKWN